MASMSLLRFELTLNVRRVSFFIRAILALWHFENPQIPVDLEGAHMSSLCYLVVIHSDA